MIVNRHSEISTLPAIERRKIMKPILEKKRRDRINKSLTELKSLILALTNKEESYGAKMEKADILEMTADYLKSLNLHSSGINTLLGSPMYGQFNSDSSPSPRLLLNDDAYSSTNSGSGSPTHQYNMMGCGIYSVEDHIPQALPDVRSFSPSPYSFVDEEDLTVMDSSYPSANRGSEEEAEAAAATSLLLLPYRREPSYKRDCRKRDSAYRHGKGTNKIILDRSLWRPW
ncbi:unnamed protein product [Gordionus sp. m RMFG-2023]